MSHVINVTLPDTLYRQLKRTAELSHQPIETIIASSLAHSLPPLLEDIPPIYQTDVYPLLQMSSTQLQIEAQKTFPRDQWEKYEYLLAKKKETLLTPDEQLMLDKLHREADILTLRKGYAAVLLKRRGYQLPVPLSP